VYEQTSTSTPYAPSRAQAITTTRLLGQVMFLVAIAIGFLALGTVLGKDLSRGTALALSLGGFGMLMISSFAGARFRVGTFAIGWLYATALVIGLGLGPTINYYASAQPDAIAQAAGGTALTVAGMGALGFAMSKDLAPWMRPLSLVVFGLIIVSLVLLVFGGLGGALSPVISLLIFGLSAALIMVDFNYLRKHGTADDTVWLATGIFVSIVNIFLSLLNLFSR
jgi:FtsH-binding integral membrane protein